MDVVVTAHNFGDLTIEQRVFERYDIDLHEIDTDDPAQIAKLAQDADALLVQYAPVTESVLSSLESLRVVGRYGIGVDNVNVDAATEQGVMVVNAPHYCTDEVAEHALSLVFACERKVAAYDRAIRSGTWDWKTGRPIRRLQGKTLALVGFGNIARSVAEKGHGLGFEVIAYDPYISDDIFTSYDVEAVDFDDVLQRGDVVSIHSPLTDETQGLFDENAFEQMGTDSTLINVARGEIVDTNALVRAVTDGEIRGAGLDVLPEEPPKSDELVDIDEIVLTPHVAWYSEDSIIELRRSIATDVADVLCGSTSNNVINPGAND